MPIVVAIPPQISLPRHRDAKPGSEVPQRRREEGFSRWQPPERSLRREGGWEPSVVGNAGESYKLCSLHQPSHQEGALHTRGAEAGRQQGMWLHALKRSYIWASTSCLNSCKVQTECCLSKEIWYLGTKLYVSISSCVFVSAGCSGLEIRGSGVGQDFPVGLPHSVNPGNYFNLYSCSADVLQHTFVNSTS